MVLDPQGLLVELARLLDVMGLRYAVGGSLASSMYGELRATNDIDVLVELPAGRVADLVTALKAGFDVWEDTVREAVRLGRSFSALHVASHVKVDFFPAGDSLLDRRQMERRRTVHLTTAPGQPVCFAAPEDIVLRKLDWYRRSGGGLERQLRDVVGVLKLQEGALDLDDLRAAARALGLDALLRRCLEDAGYAT